MGPNIYGFPTASLIYLGKEVGDLSLKEAAFLTSLLPNPLRRFRHFCEGRLAGSMEGYIKRRLFGLVELGRATLVDLRNLKHENIIFNMKLVPEICGH